MQDLRANLRQFQRSISQAPPNFQSMSIDLQSQSQSVLVKFSQFKSISVSFNLFAQLKMQIFVDNRRVGENNTTLNDFPRMKLSCAILNVSGVRNPICATACTDQLQKKDASSTTVVGNPADNRVKVGVSI